VFDELVALFRDRHPIPGDDEFPLVYPKLSDYAFPHQTLTEPLLQNALSLERLNKIRSVLAGEKAVTGPEVVITYAVPWTQRSGVTDGGVDFVFSQAVLEHVEDLPQTYSALYRWLRPGGIMSHTIDFQSHGLTKDWNGHWTLSDKAWAIVKGRRPYLINRHPYSVHKQALLRAGFRLIREDARRAAPLERKKLALRFRGISEDDLRISGVYLQATQAELL
jgi:SAM-dependent methyltransferase